MKARSLPGMILDIRRLMQTACVSSWPLVWAVVLMIVSSFFEGLTMGLLIPMMDLIIKGDSQALSSIPVLHTFLGPISGIRFRHAFFAILILVLTSSALKNLIVFLSELVVSKTSRAVENALRVKIYARYLSFSKKFLDRSKIGNVIDMATNQVLLAGDIFRFAQFFILNSILAAVYFTMMMLISWKLALASLLILPGTIALIRFLTKKIAVASEHRFEMDQKISSYLLDSLTNASLIRTYASENREVESYGKISNQSASNFHGIWKKIYFGSHALDFLLTVSIGVLLSVCLFIFLKKENAPLAAFFGFFLFLRRFSTAFNQIGDNFTSMTKSLAPIRKILWVFEDEDKEFISDGGHAPFETLNCSLTFKNISFAHNGKAVIKGVDLKCLKGRMTAIVGPTGSGKTTLINLLPRFYDPDSGAVMADGRDIREFSLKTWRTKIAMVEQDVPILNGTIRSNILYGQNGDVPLEKLDDAAKRSGIYDFISALPAGYDTEVGDRGIRLSGGERQRLAIARAILKDPEIFIFDEATSALDMETERRIQKAIEDLTQSKTVIVVAHRLSTIRNADHIVVLENGSISEEGTFDELIKNEGRFYHYWKLNKFD